MRPFLSTLLRFFAAVQTEFLVQFMSLLAFDLSLSPALFSPEFNVIKKGHIHSLHIAKIPFAQCAA